MDETQAPPPRDAATVILLRAREGAQGFETMLCKRAQGAGFLSGVHVFPGGKVDEKDRTTAEQDRIEIGSVHSAVIEAFGCASQKEANSFYVAALRETYEEVQVALRANALVPCARWITPVVETKRFDARFFIAELPASQNAIADGSETEQIDWIAPAAAYDAALAGTIRLAPPTLMMLHWLAQFTNASDALQHFKTILPPVIQPEIYTQEKGWFLAFPGDPAHSVRKQHLPGPTRLVMDDARRWIPAT